MEMLAIVIPWFGRDLKGGAEQQAWQIATRLAKRGHAVEVLATCCRSFHDDWSVNHFEANLIDEQFFQIRRFPINLRNQQAFDGVNGLMLNLPSSQLKISVNPVNPEDAITFTRDNINSDTLLEFIKEFQDNYHAFIFIPYLYGPILNGLPLVAHKAFLQPCLHNEVYAYIPQVSHIFHKAKGLLYNSDGEAKLAEKLYGPGIIPKGYVVGEGIEASQDYDEAITQVGNFQLNTERYILYLGRRDGTKNVNLLVQAYTTFKQQHPNSQLKLVLAGPGSASFQNSELGLVDLGLVEEGEKAPLLAHCLALFQPSRNESYSRVMMEAWFYGRPVAVHRDCLATAIAVENAQGGWLAGTESEWVELFEKIDSINKERLAEYGANGQVYAREHAVWDKVIERYEAVLGLAQPVVSVPQKTTSSQLKEIHQLLPNIAYGDAISNHALTIRDYLRHSGYKSDIFVRYVDERLRPEVEVFQPNTINQRAGLIYHHSIGSELTPHVIQHPGAKCLIYHNITPPEFFLPYRPEFAKILEQGRAELNELAQHFPVSVGDSAYNSAELVMSGFPDPGVLPITVDPSQWDMPANAALMEQLQDGKTNLLFVGRIAPNKCQHHLLEAFAHYLTMDSEARLILVGQAESNDPYHQHIISTIERLDLTKYVTLAGQVNDSDLLAFYRNAHLLWSMSEHEGFCVPIVEAMWFDVPVLAYKSSAVPETLGEAGLMFTSKENLLQVAALAKLLVRDRTLRAVVIKAQQKRRNSFVPTAVNEKLNNLIFKMEEKYFAKTQQPSISAWNAECQQSVNMMRVAFVIQRCGLEVNGGAETYCLKIAERMSKYWNTEILTTCALDYSHWANYYPPGVTTVSGVKVRRFWVSQERDMKEFNALSAEIYSRLKEASIEEQEAWMYAQGPYSLEMINYLEKHKNDYDAFIFFSYLYTSYFLLTLVKEKAFLVPLAHDEWPIYMSIWDSFFQKPQGFIFNTIEEQDFLKIRFPQIKLEGPIAGVVVEKPETFSAEKFRHKYNIQESFLLYIGRIDPAKGCEELFHHFTWLRSREFGSRKLVLLGKPMMAIPTHPDIISLGFVDEQTKWDALAACDVLLMPSLYESLSMVLLEAWTMAKPVFVNGMCKVLVGQCHRAQGGLWYTSEDEFQVILEKMDAKLRNQLGAQGKKFVEKHYVWPNIENAYLDLIKNV